MNDFVCDYYNSILRDFKYASSQGLLNEGIVFPDRATLFEGFLAACKRFHPSYKHTHFGFDEWWWENGPQCIQKLEKNPAPTV